MTTDLSGDFELGEDEFDWDVFLPDPDEAEIAAEAAALEDESELDLDDSEFDWEVGLREDAGTENDNGERAGAAYDRIVDTVRRSAEEDDEEPQTNAVTEVVPVADLEPETPVVVLEPETPVAMEPEPVAPPPTPAVDPAWQAGGEGPIVIGDLDEEPGWDEGPVSAQEFDSDTSWGTEPQRDTASWYVNEPDPADDVTSEAGIMAEFAPDFEDESAIAPLAEVAAGAAVLDEVETAAPVGSPDTEPAWAASAQPWEADDPAEGEPDFVDAGLEDAHGGEKKQRSRVFTATAVLACLFLVVVAAALAVRSLHHPATTAPPAAHSAPPAATSPGTGSAATTSPATARIQAATDAVDSATTAASVGLTSLTAFPTPTNVETVINPYISSLQLFQTFLSGANVPASAQAAATSAEAQLRQDLQFLDTIDGLPPQQLGAYLVQFDTDATRLQTTLNTLEQNLRAPAS
jgi:hypothetical protein